MPKKKLQEPPSIRWEAVHFLGTELVQEFGGTRGHVLAMCDFCGSAWEWHQRVTKKSTLEGILESTQRTCWSPMTFAEVIMHAWMRVTHQSVTQKRTLDLRALLRARLRALLVTFPKYLYWHFWVSTIKHKRLEVLTLFERHITALCRWSTTVPIGQWMYRAANVCNVRVPVPVFLNRP